MPITPWLHYADHPLASICRSRPGSNMPVGDTEEALRDNDRDECCNNAA